METSNGNTGVSIADGLERYLLAKYADNLDEESIKLYRRYITEFMEVQQLEGRCYLNQITADDVADYLDDCLLGDGTVKHRAQVLKMFLTYCYETKKIEKLPRIDIPKVNTERLPAPTMDDFHASLHALEERPVARMLLLTVAMTGLRRAELCALKWKDVDLDTRLLHVRKGKRRRQRFVPFNDELVTEFERYKTCLQDCGYSCGDEHPVFVSSNGKALALRAVNEIWVDVQLTTGGPRWTTHAWRRYCAKQASLNGVSGERIQNMLGHSKILMTDRYLGQLSENELRSARKSSVMASVFGDMNTVA